MPDGFDWDDDETTSEAVVKRKETTGLLRTSLLKQTEGPGAPREFVIVGEQVVVGRSADVDVRILSSSISRQHMKIKRSGPEYICEDMGSRNGMFLNGVRVHSAVLREGDHIQIGDVLLVYQDRKSPTVQAVDGP